MPDHVHGLIGITTDSPAYSDDNPPHHPAVDSLGAIIGRHKSVCTKQIRRNGIREFEWQSRFYDRIVHDADAFRAIRQYIRAHPDG